uniref:Uncharacterized protein n=1 Tax=Glossina palpalis gambiensis TaxID=67801 RepID=A0A1B0B1I1_9MUSC
MTGRLCDDTGNHPMLICRILEESSLLERVSHESKLKISISEKQCEIKSIKRKKRYNHSNAKMGNSSSSHASGKSSRKCRSLPNSPDVRSFFLESRNIW